MMCESPVTIPITSGPMDHFSNLPDDCIQHIFGFFDRDSIDAISSVSRKMHYFSSLPKYRSAKRVLNDVIIDWKERASGYEIRVQKSFAECQSIFTGQLKQANRDKEDVKARHHLSVHKLFTQLSKFLKNPRNKLEMINFHEVWADRQFINDLVGAVRYSGTIEAIIFSGSLLSCAQVFSDEQYIIRTLMTLGVSAFAFDDCSLDTFIDESVITALAAVPKRRVRILKIINECTERSKYDRIFASKRILSSIRLFDKFIVYFVTLKTEWICELIQVVLPQPAISREWKFAVTSNNVHELQRGIWDDYELTILDECHFELTYLPTGQAASISFEGPIDVARKIVAHKISIRILNCV